MKKLITFIAMALMAVSANAQTSLLKVNYEGVTEFTHWFGSSEGTDATLKMVADGVAINNPRVQDQIWTPQTVMTDDCLTLESGQDYIVRITLKVPSDGSYQIQLGSWSTNFQYEVPVTESDDWQVIDVEFPNYGGKVRGDGHVVFMTGWVVGTTIIKEVEVYEGIPTYDKWTIAGDINLLGVDWDVTYKGNNMRTSDGENYTFTKNEISLSKGTYYFKVFKDNARNESYPSNNASLTINEDAIYKVKFTFNAKTKELSAKATKAEGWAIAGDESLMGANWDVSKNKMTTSDNENYTLTKTDLTLPKGTYEYKVYNRFSTQESYPSSNARLVIDETATYTINFIFNSKTKELSATATKTDGLFFNYIAKGKIAELIQNPKGYKGTIIIPSTVTHEGEEYTVTKISDNAFSNCSRLISVTIPNSVTSIGSYAFHGCSGLTSVTIPNSVTSIDNGVFYGCGGLTSVTIPNSVTSIGWGAFEGCIKLKSIIIPNSVANIGMYAFRYCTGLTSVTIPNNVTKIENETFRYCSGLTSVTIPNSVTSIEWSAFDYCSGLTSVTIPNSVTSIGSSAFSGCSGLTSVTISNSLTSIENSAFAGCSGLTSVTIPNSVTSMGDGAFIDCSGLNSVTIGENVSWISSNAFANCQQLTDVYCLAENVPSTNADAFKDSYIEYATLHVPSASLNNYLKAEPWKNFKNKVALGDGDVPETPKCAKPTITYNNGVISFSCETEGAEFISEVKANDNRKEFDNKIILSNTYTVSVYATKAGYDNSETVTMEVIGTGGILGDLTGDGKVDVADHVKLSDIILGK